MAEIAANGSGSPAPDAPMEDLHPQRDHLKQHCHRLETELATLQTEVTRQQRQLRQLRRSVAVHTGQCTELRQRCFEYKRRRSRMSDDLKGLLATLSAKEQRLAQLQQSDSAANEEIRNLTDELEALSAALSPLTAAKAELDQRTKILDVAKQRLLGSMENDLNVTAGSRTALFSQMETAGKVLIEKVMGRDALLSNLQHCSAANSKQEAAVEALLDRNRELRQKMRLLKRRRALAAEMAAADELKQQRAGLDRRLAAKQDELSLRRQENEHLREQIEVLGPELRDYEIARQEFETSRDIYSRTLKMATTNENDFLDLLQDRAKTEAKLRHERIRSERILEAVKAVIQS